MYLNFFLLPCNALAVCSHVLLLSCPLLSILPQDSAPIGTNLEIHWSERELLQAIVDKTTPTSTGKMVRNKWIPKSFK